MSIIVIETIDVLERGSCRFSGTLSDEADDPVAAASLDDFTLTLYDLHSDTIINSRDAISVLNANGGTMGASDGVFTMQFSSLDNPIVANLDEGDTEDHYALFTATWDGGDGQLSFIVRLRVKALDHMDS